MAVLTILRQIRACKQGAQVVRLDIGLLFLSLVLRADDRPRAGRTDARVPSAMPRTGRLRIAKPSRVRTPAASSFLT
jgi:hypothetical protein